MSAINQCEFYCIYKIQSEKLIIHFRSTYNTTLCVLFFCHRNHQIINSTITFYSLNWLASKDNITTIRKWTMRCWNRIICILSHNYDISLGKLLKTLEILRNMPRELVRGTYKKCGIHGQNSSDMHNITLRD